MLEYPSSAMSIFNVHLPICQKRQKGNFLGRYVCSAHEKTASDENDTTLFVVASCVMTLNVNSLVVSSIVPHKPTPPWPCNFVLSEIEQIKAKRLLNNRLCVTLLQCITISKFIKKNSNPFKYCI